MIYTYRHKNNFTGVKILIGVLYLYFIYAIYLNIVTQDWMGLINLAIAIVLVSYLCRVINFNAVVDTGENLIYTTPHKFAIDINRIKYVEAIRRHDGSVKAVLLRTTETEYFKLSLKDNEMFIEDMMNRYPHIKQIT